MQTKVRVNRIKVRIVLKENLSHLKCDTMSLTVFIYRTKPLQSKDSNRPLSSGQAMKPASKLGFHDTMPHLADLKLRIQLYLKRGQT